MRALAPLAAGLVLLLFATLLVPATPAQRLLFALARSAVAGPAPQPVRTEAAVQPVLRVAIGAMMSPERVYVHYRRFFAELARVRGERLHLLQRVTYREINELLRSGGVDLAWICTGAWPDLEASGGASLVAVPVMYGRTTYQSLLLAGPGTTATDWAGLRGARFAFTDLLSLTGRQWPMRRVRENGGSDESYFASTVLTNGHDLSIEAVRRGLVDAASVDSLVYRFLEERFPDEVAGIRVLERSPEFPIPPLAVSGRLPPDRATALREDLLAVAASAHGRAILLEIGVDGLEPADPARYRTLP